jgi:NAD(P)-dependent dehydrogenase (short-subunit alcohol dehydrogenase family)
MAQEFLERVAIVIGAREGMELACAELLAEGGAGVVLVSRNEEQLSDVGNRIALKTKNENLIAVAGDVGKDEDVKNVVDRSMERFGKIDYLLNFAGYNRDYPKISRMRPNREAMEILEMIVNTDLFGTVRMVFHVEPTMRKQKNGVIITVGSTPVIDRGRTICCFKSRKWATNI